MSSAGPEDAARARVGDAPLHGPSTIPFVCPRPEDIPNYYSIAEFAASLAFGSSIVVPGVSSTEVSKGNETDPGDEED